MENTCSVCGNENIFLRKKGTAVGMYCLGCGKWFKWVGKKEVKELQHKGHKVHPEDYIPNQESQTANTQTTNEPKIGKPFQPKVFGDDELPNFGEVEDDFIEPKTTNKLSNDYKTGNQQPQQSNHQTTKEETTNSDHCPTCISKVIEPVNPSEEYVMGFTGRKVIIRDRKFTKMLSTFDIKYCPTCGTKL